MKKFTKLKQRFLLFIQGKRPNLTYNLTEKRISKLCTIYSYEETKRRFNYGSWEPHTVKWSTTRMGVFKPEVQNWLDTHEHVIIEMDVKNLTKQELMDMPDNHIANHWAIRFFDAKTMALFKLTWA